MSPKDKLPQDWTDFLAPFPGAWTLEEILAQVEARRQKEQVFPPEGEVFRAFSLCRPQDVRCVLIGQDPYHQPGQAHGLAFSVRQGVKLPPSLKNIFKALHHDIGFIPPEQGDLSPWAENGVLLLNSTLTVGAGKAASHKDIHWERFTDFVVKRVAENTGPTVFLLWGGHARQKREIITKKTHLILEIGRAHV